MDYYYGKKASAEYVIGTRIRIRNDRPIIGDYNVNSEGSSDMYYKGANMIHMLRQLVSSLYCSFVMSKIPRVEDKFLFESARIG